MTERVLTWYAAMGGRKFLCTGFVLLATTALRAFDMIDQGTWERVSLAALAIYGTANVTQKATAKLNRKGEVAAP